MAKEIPSKQRALVLQGGGALGAYQVGVLKVLSKKIIEEDKKNAEPGRPLFDIIAGTSIDAMNAAVLVSNVVRRNKTWTEAISELERFWKVDIALIFHHWRYFLCFTGGIRGERKDVTIKIVTTR